MEDQLFVDLVKSEMAQIGSDNGIPDDGDRFAIWFLIKILREPAPESSEIYHIGGAGDNKLDFAILDEQHSAIVLGQCKFRNNPLDGHKFDADLPEEIKNARDRFETMPLAGNERRRAFVERYKEKPEGIPERLMAVGFGTFSETAVQYATRQKIEIYDFKKIKDRYIYNEVLGEKKPPDIMTLSLPDDQVIFRKIDALHAKQWAFLGKAREIYSALHKYEDGLFAQNLRYRLEESAKSGIAKDIFDTVMCGDNSLTIYNNGLTIIAQHVEAHENHLVLHNPQIVNGCQTSWAIHDALDQKKKSGEDPATNETEILIKLIETNSQSLIDKVTQTTNQQNAISWRDIKANDNSQRQIAMAFSVHNPRILYESKEGTWESLVREKKTAPYRISGKKNNRRISNIEAGQLYLAMLGLPYFSKQNKAKIFNDPDYYKTIYQVGLTSSERFESSSLGLSASDVFLKGGSAAFKNDVLFAYGVYQLGDALKSIYSSKMKSYGAEIRPEHRTAYDKLDQDFQFYKFWHYLLVAGVYYVTRLWRTGFDVDEDALRSELIGTDWNLLFGPGKTLSSEFKPNENKRVYLIVDEEHPSEKFGTFARWAVSLAEKVSELGGNRRLIEGGKFRYLGFIDQRQETYADLKSWIDVIFAGGKKKAMEKFAIQRP